MQTTLRIDRGSPSCEHKLFSQKIVGGDQKRMSKTTREELKNKARYTALGAPKHLYKTRGYGPTDA